MGNQKKAVIKKQKPTADSVVRLNLGSGPHKMAGYQNVDRLFGREVYPLAAKDASVDEIRASHILEHFPYEQVKDVLSHWVSKLKPGGVCKIAVPNFAVLCDAYQKESPLNVQVYVMGGHTDDNDRHQSIFDYETLFDLMADCGLCRISEWESDCADASALPLSLNLMGYKPAHEVSEMKSGTIRAVLGAARFGPTLHFRCAFKAFETLRVPYSVVQGCFWHQNLSNAIEIELEKPGCEYILTSDYDSIFTHEDIVEMYRVMTAYPNVNALCALQSKRDMKSLLFTMKGANGVPVTEINMTKLRQNALEVSTGHFGLTMFRASVLRDFPKPWMNDSPNAEGSWREGRVDADISFWNNWAAYGQKLFLAPKVVIGHAQELIAYPSVDGMIYQSFSDFEETGKPKGILK